MTNRAEIFARSIQCLSLTFMMMMSLMNTSIDSSVAAMSTAKGVAIEIWISDCFVSSCGSKDSFILP